jgi:hypothetical protein
VARFLFNFDDAYHVFADGRIAIRPYRSISIGALPLQKTANFPLPRIILVEEGQQKGLP